MNKIDKLSSPIALNIQLGGVVPAVWRRIVVPSHIGLSKLSDAIQIVMGWGSSHLHEFIINQQRFGNLDRDFQFAKDIQDQRYKRLITVLGHSKKFSYIYDFSDHWVHDIEVELVPEGNFPIDKITLVSAQGACPPEDIGGTLGFTQFKRIMADHQHPEHDDMRCWYGKEFSLAFSDFNRVHAALNKIKL